MSRTPLMLAAALAAGTASVTPASAGGCGGGTCYRQEYVPPSYRTVAERVMVRAPRTYAQVIPAQYGYVNETVQVSGAQRYWTYKHDQYGRKIKCLVEAPARFAQVSRRVMVRGPEVVPQYVPAAYATRQYTVQDQPGYSAWVPLGGGGYRGASYGASADYGAGYGGGYSRASYGGGYGAGYGASSGSYGSGYGASSGGGYGSGYGAAYGGGYGRASSYGGGYGRASSYGGGYGGGLIGAGLGAVGAGLGAGGGYGEY